MQDVQYADIDYMDHQADFTLGENFTNLPEFVRNEAQNGLRFIPILDPAINTEKTNIDYVTHTNAMQAGAYITWYNDTLQPSDNCTASPGDCQFLDNIMLGYVSFQIEQNIDFDYHVYHSNRCGRMEGQLSQTFSSKKHKIGGNKS